MNASRMLRDAARLHGASPAILAQDTLLSYAELDERASRFAIALRGLGVAPGERVGILCRNLAAYPVALFGIARAGCVAVHLSVRYAPGELDYVLGKVPLAALVVDAGLGPLHELAKAKLPAARLLTVGGDGAMAFDALVAGATPDATHDAVDEDGPSAILFTSGTTGFPKGALQPTHGRYVSAVAAQHDFRLTERDVIAVASPLYHAATLYTWYHCAVLAGTSAVLMPAWDPEAFMADTARLGITGAFAVPTQLAMLVRAPGFDAKRLASLRIVVFGGAIADPDLIAQVSAALPHVRFVQNYGQTETGPLFSQQPGDRARNRAAIGRANPHIELALLRADGMPAPQGEVGEIATRGAHVGTGYFEDAQASAEFFKFGNGWAATGDLAVMDAEGQVTLVGRTKDTIISGAINIYPSEVERVARAHPAVADCAAFGVKDAVWGELPALAVVAKPGMALDPADILALYDGTQIGRHKRPRAVHVVEALPYTPVGKLLRGELRKRFPVLEPESAPKTT
jgi:fatty-acyl-CoA synthase